jgi:hypothetical protein
VRFGCPFNCAKKIFIWQYAEIRQHNHNASQNFAYEHKVVEIEGCSRGDKPVKTTNENDPASPAKYPLA